MSGEKFNSNVLYWPFRFKFQPWGISLPERSKITVLGRISRYSLLGLIFMNLTNGALRMLQYSELLDHPSEFGYVPAHWFGVILQADTVS